MKTYKITDLFKTSWAELTAKEMIALIDLSELLKKYPEESRDYGMITIAILRLLRKNKSVVAKIELEQAVDCFNDITFFRRTAKGSFQTPWYFFPVGNFNHSGVDFVRPEMSGTLPMYNRSFDQLVYADAAFSNFCILNHEQHSGVKHELDDFINALIAVLYTQPKRFSIADMETKSKLVQQHLTVAERALILHTYANVRSYILDRCPHLFPPSVGPDEAEGYIEGVSTGEMWLNIRYDLAETEVFKGFDTARSAMIYDALDYLEKKARDVHEQKQKQPAHA